MSKRRRRIAFGDDSSTAGNEHAGDLFELSSADRLLHVAQGFADIPTDSGSVVTHSSDFESADACEVCALTQTAHSETVIAR
jgi:hypothetical protein